MMFFARCSVAFKKCQRTIDRSVAFHSTDAPLALGNNYWARSSNILQFLVKESKILFFWSHVLITSCLTGEKKASLGNWYHPLCLKCKKCGRQLATGSHAEVNFCSFPYTLFKFRIFPYKTHNIQFIALPNTMTTAHFCLWVIILVPCLTHDITRNWRNGEASKSSKCLL